MPKRRRLDAEMVRRGMVATRSEARRVIEAGGVTVGGRLFARPATLVAAADPILLPASPRWASRAGDKLAGALDDLGIAATGRRALDVGASTGGFTDVLLARGAASVVAVDVGYGQMLTRLSNDPRVTVQDRVNFRTADPAAVGAPFDLVVADVSFISLTNLAVPLREAGAKGTDYAVLVKPQFEVGRGQVGRGGVVRDPVLHGEAVRTVADALAGQGLAPVAACASRLRGAAGNREFFIHAVWGGEPLPPDSIVDEAMR